MTTREKVRTEMTGHQIYAYNYMGNEVVNRYGQPVTMERLSNEFFDSRSIYPVDVVKLNKRLKRIMLTVD